MKKLIIAISIFAIIGWSLTLYELVSSAPQEYIEPTITEVLPDHSNCQYPNRLSNPPDGCDNSDPANPQCMKYGTEECDIPTDTTPWIPQEATVEPELAPVETCK